jgi:hypothetical protein
MARIKFTAIVEDIRGSIGGTTFQRNKYGYTCKRKPRMTLPNSQYQNRQKGYFGTAIAAWRELTQAVRDSWDTWASTYPSYAKHNPSAQLSGYAVYTRTTVYTLMQGYQPRTSAPSFTLESDDTLTWGLALAGGVLTLNVTSVTDTEGWELLIFVSRPLSSAQMFVGTKTRLLPLFAANADMALNITSHYINQFGVLPAVGDRVALDWIMFNQANGQTISRQSLILTVA